MCDLCLVVLACMKTLCELGRLSSLHASLFFAMSLKQFGEGFFGLILQITAVVPEIRCSLLEK